jgi:hypothetical protein
MPDEAKIKNTMPLDPLALLHKQGKELLNVLSSGRESSDLIPAKVLEQHIAILGKTGSGKSYTAKGIVETLLAQKQRVCVIDPTGVWWGLRSDSTGKKLGFPIIVLGGEGDLLLNPDHGAAIAEIIGTTDTSAILNTRTMTIKQRTGFFADFAETLLRKNTGPLTLVIDEAHLFMPQTRPGDVAGTRMLDAANNLVSLGRGIGLRIILISQRPAKVHKDSLTQAETLIVMRLIAPQDRRAVEDWIGEWAQPHEGRELLRSLQSLPTGEGWLWAPELGILDYVEFPRIKTYDSSRAPDGTKRLTELPALRNAVDRLNVQVIAERLKNVPPPGRTDKRRRKDEELREANESASSGSDPSTDLPTVRHGQASEGPKSGS